MVEFSDDGKRIIKGVIDEIPEGIEVIERDVWFTNSAVAATLPKSLKYINGNLFVDSHIEKIVSKSPNFVVEDGVLYTSDKKKIVACFSEATSFNMPDTVTHIGHLAFGGTNIEEIKLSESLTHIEDNAFEDLSCKEISLSQSLTYIGNAAFEGNSNLEKIIIPSSVTYIGDNPFAWCCLKQIECESPHFCIENNALLSKDKKQLITYFGQDINYAIPDTVTHIGNRAFDNDNSIKYLEIPSSVVSIGICAFDFCSLNHIKCLSDKFVVHENALYTADMQNLICCFGDRQIFQMPQTVKHVSAKTFPAGLKVLLVPESVCKDVKNIVSGGIVFKDNLFNRLIVNVLKLFMKHK